MASKTSGKSNLPPRTLTIILHNFLQECTVRPPFTHAAPAPLFFADGVGNAHFRRVHLNAPQNIHRKGPRIRATSGQFSSKHRDPSPVTTPKPQSNLCVEQRRRSDCRRMACTKYRLPSQHWPSPTACHHRTNFLGRRTDDQKNRLAYKRGRGSVYLYTR